MAAYDPRTATGLPTEPVGPLPRPAKLQEATYPIATTLAGTGLAPSLGPGGQFFAIFADGHGFQIGSTDDCGFSPFSIDEKPNHGSPDYARDVAFGKIKSRVEGSRLAAEKLGL